MTIKMWTRETEKKDEQYARDVFARGIEKISERCNVSEISGPDLHNGMMRAAWREEPK